MTTAVTARLNSQELAYFKINFASNVTLSYDSKCTDCSSSEYMATEYFDTSKNVSSQYITYGPIGPYDGYEYSSAAVDSVLCVNFEAETSLLCSNKNVTVEAVHTID